MAIRNRNTASKIQRAQGLRGVIEGYSAGFPATNR